MKKRYRLKADAPAWVAELEYLWEGREVLTAADVVEWARNNPDSELHGRFEWDDRTAAARHREDQARQMIREIRVYVEARPDLVVPIAVHLRRDGDGYRLTADALEDRPAEVTREEARRLLFAIERARMFPSLQDRASLVVAEEDMRRLAEEAGEEDAA